MNWLTTSTGASTSLALSSPSRMRRPRLAGKGRAVGGGVVVADAEESEQPGAREFGDHLAVDGDGGG